MKIALAQINPIIGDISSNANQIHQQILRAREHQAQLVIFPELALIGYPPRDLLLKPAVIDRCVQTIEALAIVCTDIAAIIGYPCPNDQAKGRPLYNAVALCQGGAVVNRTFKSLLPTYDVFDEQRYFEPGPASHEVLCGQIKLGVSICEDLWNDPQLISRQLYHTDPIETLANTQAQLLINCSASPFTLNKHAFRLRLLKAAAKRMGRPVVFCNQVGSNDDLVFDGNSCVIGATGNVIAHAKDFESDLLIADIDLGDESPPIDNRCETPKEGIESVYHALVLGLRDYCHKCGFTSAVLGLSGGIDSALTAVLAVAALGPQRVRAVAMPSRYSSKGSITDAAELARRLGIQFDVIPIEKTHHAFDQVLVEQFRGLAVDTTEENIQARIRGTILMALSNKWGSLLVTTGNKSEMAVGYCTLYGDMAGGLAILSDVPKTMVNQLAQWINQSSRSRLGQQLGHEVIPKSTLTKPPSAELRPDQVDQDSLPPYPLLDQIIERYVELEQSGQQIIDELAGTSPHVNAQTVEQVIRMIDRNEYKRRQAAPGLKVTSRAFGFGRRMPIAQRWND